MPKIESFENFYHRIRNNWIAQKIAFEKKKENLQSKLKTANFFHGIFIRFQIFDCNKMIKCYTSQMREHI